MAVKVVLKGVRHKRLDAMDSALPLINGKGCRRIKINKLTSTTVDLAVVKMYTESNLSFTSLN